MVEAAGVELSRRIENRELIEKLENRDTRNTHDWAFHCTRIAHTKRRDSRRAPHFGRSALPASKREAAISRFPAFNFRYCFSSTSVETLPLCLLSETVVIFFPSGETVIFWTL